MLTVRPSNSFISRTHVVVGLLQFSGGAKRKTGLLHHRSAPFKCATMDVRDDGRWKRQILTKWRKLLAQYGVAAKCQRKQSDGQLKKKIAQRICIIFITIAYASAPFVCHRVGSGKCSEEISRNGIRLPTSAFSIGRSNCDLAVVLDSQTGTETGGGGEERERERQVVYVLWKQL